MRPAILEAAVDSLTPSEVRLLVSLLVNDGTVQHAVADAIEYIRNDREETTT